MQQHASTYSVLTGTLDPWGGVKGQTLFFLKVVMLHIKSIGMEHRAPCKHIIILFLQISSALRVGSKDFIF